ncbi:MAG TPA: protein kinase [Anaerolineae bacterium]|nr:protein kinase [Anaerolineae bacterium]
MSQLIGSMLGKYRIVARVGQGGMAQVFKAYQPNLDRYVAIKVLHEHLAAVPHVVGALSREALAMARLRHANIVQVHDFDQQETEAGRWYYIVMEFIDGPTLQAEMGARQAQERPFTLQEAVTIMSSLATAIDYAHSRGMAHRDLKPSNIMFTPNGQPLITDFGLARLLDGEGGGVEGPEGVAGTPAYMSPEQAQGALGDTLSDIYALGVILFEMITGSQPFSGQTTEELMLQRIQREFPRPSLLVPDLPEALEAVILKATARKPEQRYRRGQAMAAALKESVANLDEDFVLTPASIVSPPTQIGELTPASNLATVVSGEESGIRSPYRGLFAFQEEDAPFFFGREEVTNRLVKQALSQPMVAILGPSGSGKSSVMMAGLIPAVRTEPGWLIAHFRPGRTPFVNVVRALWPWLGDDNEWGLGAEGLASQLAAGEVLFLELIEAILAKTNGARRVMLVADQFEELFTLVNDGTLREGFLEMLTTAVVAQMNQQDLIFTQALTMRADFLGQALLYRDFADILQDHTFILGPMTRRELTHAIVSPSQKFGIRFEAGLVERILNDVGGEPGNLPLLEFALTLLWERRDGRKLTHADYEEIGQVEGALAQYADDIYAALSAGEQKLARGIFTQVVRPGEGTEDTRRVATRAELGEEMWGLAQVLADARLLVTGRDSEEQETVEVVHEALLRSWGLLRDWMRADRAFRVWQERLRASWRQWQASGEDEGALLRGVPLAEAEGWLEVDDYQLSEREVAFIKRSQALVQAEETAREAQRARELEAAQRLAQAERERADEQARAGRWMRWLSVGLSIVFLIAVVFAIAARNQRQSALAEVVIRTTAEAQAAESADYAMNQMKEAEEARELVAVSATEVAVAMHEVEVERDNAEAAAVAAEAARIEAAKQAQNALSRQLATQSLMMMQNDYDTSLLLSLASLQISDTVAARTSLLTGLDQEPRLEAYLTPPTGVASAVAVSGGGEQIAVLSDQLYFWDLERGEWADAAWKVPFGADVLAVSDSGDAIAVAGLDEVWLWTGVVSGEVEEMVVEARGSVLTLTFAPGGELLAMGGGERVVQVWDVGAEDWLYSNLLGHTGDVYVVEFGPDGVMLASGGIDRNVRLWDMETGEAEVVPNVGAWVSDVAFEAAGRALLISGCGEIDVETNDCRLPILTPHLLRDVELDTSLAVEIETVFRFLAVGGGGGGPNNGNSFIAAIEFSPNNDYLVLARQDELMVQSVAAQQPIRPMHHFQANIVQVVFVDELRMVSVDNTGTVLLWNLATESRLGEVVNQMPRGVTGMALSAGGNRGIIHENGDVYRWQADGERLGPPLALTMVLTNALNDVMFSGSGEWLTSLSERNELVWWEVGAEGIDPIVAPNQVLAGPFDHVAWGDELLVVADVDAVSVWDVGGVELLRTWPISESVSVVAMSGDERYVAAGGEDGYFWVWEVATGQLLLATDEMGGIELTDMVFHATLPVVVVGSAVGEVYVWDMTEGVPRGRLLLNVTNYVYGLALAPEGDLLAIAAEDEALTVYNWRTGESLATDAMEDDGVEDVVWTEGSGLMTTGWDGGIVSWEVEGNVLSGETLVALDDANWWLATSTDGRWAAVTGQNRRLALVDVAENRLAMVVENHEVGDLSAYLMDGVMVADDKMLVAGTRDLLVSVWAVEARETVTVVMPPVTVTEREPAQMVFSDDGRWLAIGDSQGMVVIVDVAQGEVVFSDHLLDEEIGGMDWGGSGRWLGIAGSESGEVMVIDSERREVVASWSALGTGITALVFSDDENSIVVGGAAKAQVWEDWLVVARRVVPLMVEADELVTTFLWGGDDTWLLWGEEKGHVIWWDLKARQQIFELDGFIGGSVLSLLSNDDESIWGLLEGGRLWRWDLGPEEWQTAVCDLVNRDLTESEQAVYGDAVSSVCGGDE